MIGDQVWWNVNVQPTPPTIPVIFCVDVEPDPRQGNRDAREPWVGYEFTQRYLRDLRPRIEALTEAPVHFSWFLRMDRQVAEPYGSATWVADSYRAHMDEIQRAGDEIGVHPHPYRWLGARPADQTVQHPEKFDLVINLKTAKALALTIPQSVRLRADEVIQ